MQKMDELKSVYEDKTKKILIDLGSEITKANNSLLERTKEIGIMRSLGARKKDIARIFNAETIIIGFVSGIFGVTITLVLNIPIDIVIFNLIEVQNFTSLSPLYGFGLIFLSTLLTLLAGLIPSRIAANKDPVIALRTE
jgi:putative ABC transport system permease protein